MTADELLAEVRRLLRDTEPDYIFSDAAIYDAINSAQQEAARFANVLKGERPVTILANEYRTAVPDDMYVPMTVVYDGKEQSLLSPRKPWDDFWLDNGYLYTRNASPIDRDVILHGYLEPAVVGDTNPVLEIPERFHYNLANGAARNLLRTLDADMEDQRRLRLMDEQWARDIDKMYRWSAKFLRPKRTARYGGL